MAKYRVKAFLFVEANSGSEAEKIAELILDGDEQTGATSQVRKGSAKPVVEKEERE